MKPCPEEKHILILDGHHSQKTLAAVEYARAHGIEMVTLPPHCTHKMQLLDRTFLKAMKSGYNLAADTWMVVNPGKRITFFEMAGIFATAYTKSATIEKAVNGFRDNNNNNNICLKSNIQTSSVDSDWWLLAFQ